MALRPVASVPAIVAALAPHRDRRSNRHEPPTASEYFAPRFTSYARVVNSVESSSGEPVRWSTFANRPLDADTSFSELREQPNDEPEPEIGTIDREVARELSRVLARHTSTPDECYFLAWDGYGDDVPKTATTILIAPYDRRMLVLGGSVEDAIEPFEDGPHGRRAQWWIPGDGAWSVGNDIYGNSVYVAGSEAAISDILSSTALESFRAIASTRLIGEEL
ncbi:MAG: hypothetical protein QOK08_1373 [Actinomycetota bacterium]|nr:hypothetical protein [Actinomycetota bacterium]